MCPLSFSLYDKCRRSCWVGGANGCLSHREHCMLTPRLRPSQRKSGEGAHDSGVWKRSVRLENVMSVYLYICWWEHGSKTVCCVYGLFSVKGLQAEDGLLAQALEGWVLQQAVTGLKQSGQHDQAETLCSQVHTHTHACFLFICHAVPYWCVSCVNRAQVQTQTGWPVLGFQREPCARFMRWHGTICLISIYCGFLSAHNAWAVPLWGVFVKQECPVLLLKG